jgi:chromosome segregation ATPase
MAMNKATTKESNIRPEPDEGASEYLETIALLQEEILRLESELLACEPATASVAGFSRKAEEEARQASQSSREEIDKLTTELAVREETINLLIEQLRLVEEAEAASRAEWEQLSHWIAEVEQRVDRQAQSGADRQVEELASQQRQTDEYRSQLENERSTWSQERRALEQEIRRLGSLLASASQGSGKPGADAEALAVLEAENKRLVKRCTDLEETSSTEIGTLREAAESARRELAETRRQRDQIQDERDRERREYEIAVASLRAHSSRSSLAAGEPAAAAVEASTVGATATESPKTTDNSIALEADMRIRAFRQHLKEIHCHETEARNRNKLSARLSRLWNRTATTSQ